MDAQQPVRHNHPAIVGVILVVFGAVALVLPRSGWDIEGWIEGSGWPIFVVIPGLVLWLLAFVPRPPVGVGFAIAGSIVTAVGLLLWYQQSTDSWESWAYAWALIGPGAAGFGLIVYGLATGTQRLVSTGLWLAAIGLAIFLVGAMFFETVFRTGVAPFDAGQIWPVVVIGIGVAVVVAAFRDGRSTRGQP